MRDKSDAEDIVQDTFVKLVEKNPLFSSHEHETAWLITVAKNLCVSRLRSPWRKNKCELLESYPTRDSREHELIELVGSLPTKYRIVIHLHYYEGYSTSEIAKITKQKDSTVRQQLARARGLLKQQLTEE
jgi:RNA polymerase sigma-70 factor (ECF subfamily)